MVTGIWCHLLLESRSQRWTFEERNKMPRPTSDFFMTLPSNASTQIYSDNGPSGFTVMLPQSYEFERDEWEVASTNIVYPHTWTNTAAESSPQGKIYVSTNTNQNVVNLPPGNYRNAEDVFMGIKRALVKFGQKDPASQAIVDHFTFVEDNNRMSLIIDDIRMHFGLDLDLTALLKPDSANAVSNSIVPLPPSSTSSFQIKFDSVDFQVLGNRENQPIVTLRTPLTSLGRKTSPGNCPVRRFKPCTCTRTLWNRK